ncbi:MAG TPA: hypothetical protein VFE55_12570 [Acidimicrobiia bacterium]|nr:hypothetical protein [Acidimicrobiia bacterium]
MSEPGRAPGPWAPVLRPHPFSLLVGAVCGILALGLTTDRLLLGIDWDNASHYASMVQTSTHPGALCGYGRTVWTCGYTAHMALVPVYGVGARIAGIFGGGIFTGMRLVNAASIAGAAALVALIVRRLGGSPLLSAVAAGAFLFTEDVLQLIRTVEDDCLSLFWMSAILYLCVREGRRFTPRTALGCGVLVGAAALTNYPMLVWMPVVLAAATVYARPELPAISWHRLLLPALVILGFCGTVALYGAWVHVRDPASWSWSQYGHVLTMPPNELAGEAGHAGRAVEYVAAHPLAVAIRGYPTDWILAAPVRARAVALLLFGALGTGVIAPLRRGPRNLSARGRAVSVSCLALIVCTLPAAWKNDPTYFERMNHVPLCLVTILAAVSAGPVGRTWYGPVRKQAALVLAGLSLALGVRAVAVAPRSQSWLARFRAVREQHDGADAFVYSESDLRRGDYDELASLAVAMDHVIVLSPSGAAQAWPVHPFTVLPVEQYRRCPPARPFLTESAQALIAPESGPTVGG